jgi:hypothetical protein
MCMRFYRYVARSFYADVLRAENYPTRLVRSGEDLGGSLVPTRTRLLRRSRGPPQCEPEPVPTCAIGAFRTGGPGLSGAE